MEVFFLCQVKTDAGVEALTVDLTAKPYCVKREEFSRGLRIVYLFVNYLFNIFGTVYIIIIFKVGYINDKKCKCPFEHRRYYLNIPAPSLTAPLRLFNS